MKKGHGSASIGLTVDDAYQVVSMSRKESHVPENKSACSTITGPINASRKCSIEKITGISAMRGLPSA